jgi:uncharacterized protein
MDSLLPACAYKPGHSGKPDRDWLNAIKHNYGDRALVDKGFDLVRAGYFWEAHELLEKAWLARTPNSPEREMLRAIIQIANALLKLSMDKEQAAAKLFAEAGTMLASLPPDVPVFGSAPARLLANITAAAPELPARKGPNLRKLQNLVT